MNESSGTILSGGRVVGIDLEIDTTRTLNICINSAGVEGKESCVNLENLIKVHMEYMDSEREIDPGYWIDQLLLLQARLADCRTLVDEELQRVFKILRDQEKIAKGE